MPKVSIVIPTYNRDTFLPEALESALAQTYRDIEIIIVDDGSVDGSRSVIDGYVHKYPGRIRCYYQKNKGPSAARNRGIREARGEFVAFLDSDDLWLPEKIETQVGQLARDEACGFAYTGYYLINEKNRAMGVYGTEPVSKKKVLDDIYIRNSTSQTSTIMVRKGCFDTVGFFDESLQVAEDWDMWLRIITRYDFCHARKPLVRVRMSEGSQSSWGQKNLENGMKLLDKLFSDPALSKRPLLKRKSYGYRYWAVANSYRINGDLDNARKYLRTSIACYPWGALKTRSLTLMAHLVFGEKICSGVKMFLKRLSPVAFAKKAYTYLLEVERYIVMETNIGGPLIAKTPLIGIDIREIAVKELAAIANDHDAGYVARLKMSKEIVEKRTKMGHACIGAFLQGELCGYLWNSTDYIERTKGADYRRAFSGIGYIFDVYVRPEYRNSGMASALYRETISLMRHKRCLRIIGLFLSGNKASEAVMRRVGFTRSGKITVMTAFRKYKSIFTSGVQRDIVDTIELLRGEKF